MRGSDGAITVSCLMFDVRIFATKKTTHHNTVLPVTYTTTHHHYVCSLPLSLSLQNERYMYWSRAALLIAADTAYLT